MRNLPAFARVLADESRWRILQLVQDEALCVCELAGILEMPQSTVSSHLQVIRRAGLVEEERCGKWIYYRLEAQYLPLIRSIAEFFGVRTTAAFKRDSRRAARRMAARATSCCPPPVLLRGARTAPGGAGVEEAAGAVQTAG